MNIFALSDLHLSLAAPYRPGVAADLQLQKPMSAFGPLWRDYFVRLEENWHRLVSEQDCVLVAGDISWALTLAEARFDLAYLASLPGRKVLCKGNHDYWWASLARLRELVDPSITVLQHSATTVGDYAVCGTRGWLLPQHSEFKEAEDRKLYEREVLRLEMALQEAAKLQKPIIAMLHYPPLLKEHQDSEFCQLLRRYQVHSCVYGHVHGEMESTFEGQKDGIRYVNTSIDRLDFTPLLIATTAANFS